MWECEPFRYQHSPSVPQSTMLVCNHINIMPPWRAGTLVPDSGQWSGLVPNRLDCTMVHTAITFELPRTTLHIRTKVLSAISSAGIGLRATLSLHMFLVLNSYGVHVVSPPLILPLTRGFHGVTITFMDASKMMHCIASVRSVSSCA